MKTPTFKSLGSILLLSFILLFSNSFAQNYCYQNSGNGKFKYSDGFANYDIQVKGDITVNDDDTDIKSISAGGYLKFSKKTFGNKRSITIESNSQGNLTYEYYEGRSKTPYEPEGRKWLADVLLEVIHMTGIDAEGRTKRIYSKKGVDGVLEEINIISSNSVMAMYFDALLKNTNLNTDELLSVCSGISKEMSSNTQRGKLYRDYSDLFLANNTTAANYFNNISKLSSNTERGSILTHISKKIDFNDPSVTEAYFACIDKISSNTESGRILRHTERNQELSTQAYTRLLVSTKKLSSNTETGSVLRSLDNLDMGNPDISTAYFNAIDGMTSNTEAGSTMRHLIENHDLNEDNLVRLLGSTKKLTSNTEMGSVLRAINELDLGNPRINDAYFLTINSFTSNTEAGSVLRYTLKNHQLNNDSWAEFFSVTGRLTSNSTMGSVLSDAIDYVPFDDESIVDGFFLATAKFTSNTEYGRVLREMISNPAFNKYTAFKTLESARKLTSNTEKGSVLDRLADTEFVKDPTIRKLYMNTAKTLTSDSEYRRVVDNLIE
ncbi:MAG: hypothetical protein GXO89_11845 [Chlorobi bacterium]|nr:hypothetical protein [Chlorobiota bacterium]